MMDRIDRKNFIFDMAEVINRHNVENASNTPDIILAEHLYDCIEAWNRAVKLRNDWFYSKDRVNTTIIDPMQPNSHQK